MKEKSHHFRLIFSVMAIAFAFVVAFLILTTQTSAITAQPQVAAGYAHTVGLKSDGTVVAVGDNFYGQLNVGSWKDIEQMAAGRHHTVGLKSDGTVVAVGDNGFGQLNVGSWKDIE
jgi:alpha-tubulin suppressor-like RCC1 family protein